MQTASGAIVETIPAIYKGSIIVFKGGIYRVKRLNSKSLAVTDVDGKDWKLTLPNEQAWNSVREATPEQAEAFRAEEFTTQTTPERLMRVGNVVTWPDCTHKLGKDKLLVVTKVQPDGAANLVPLGGVLTGEYFRSVPAVKLRKVEGEVHVTNV